MANCNTPPISKILAFTLRSGWTSFAGIVVIGDDFSAELRNMLSYNVDYIIEFFTFTIRFSLRLRRAVVAYRDLGRRKT
jgi:hypothetical protein